MRIVEISSVAMLVLGMVVCGCEKKSTPGPSRESEDQQGQQEVAMGTSLKWLGHASFKIRHDDTVIYIDPWKLKDAPHDATLVLVSHSHHDHYSAADISKVSGPDTRLLASADVAAKQRGAEPMLPGLAVDVNGVRVTPVPAYNLSKRFHPKSSKWLGFVIEVGSKRIYYAGDTDLTDEVKAPENIDLALLPVGGTYTMNAEEAAEATRHIKPGLAVPYHWGDIVGAKADADKFAELAGCEVKVLSVGETLSLE